MEQIFFSFFIENSLHAYLWIIHEKLLKKDTIPILDQGVLLPLGLA